jgi:hypothetical protein
VIFQQSQKSLTDHTGGADNADIQLSHGIDLTFPERWNRSEVLFGNHNNDVLYHFHHRKSRAFCDFFVIMNFFGEFAAE